MFSRLARHFHKFRRAEDGVALAFFAVMLFALLGMAALAIDVSHAYANRQRMQSAADAGAMSGAIAVAYAQNEVTDGRAASASSGWTNGSNGISVAINRPPTMGALAGDNQAVEAIVQQPMSTSFSNMFGLTSMTVNARAVARVPNTSYCMIALSSSDAKAFDIAGNTTIGTPSCGMASNSTKKGATNGGFNVQGNSTVNAPIRSAGSISEPGNPSVYSAPPFPMENAPAVADPYEANGQKAWLMGLSMTPTPPGKCKQSDATRPKIAQGSTVTGGGVYCFLDLNGGTTTLQNGIYYLYPETNNAGNPKTGSIGVTGANTKLVTQNATLIVFSDVSITGIVQLSGMTSGSSSGFALASPVPTSPPKNVVDIAGGNTSSLIGAIYLPVGGIKIRGSFVSACAQIIAKTIDAGGTIQLAYDGSCGGQNVTNTGVVSMAE